MLTKEELMDVYSKFVKEHDLSVSNLIDVADFSIREASAKTEKTSIGHGKLLEVGRFIHYLPGVLHAGAR